jgi:hypothetical protein
MGASDGLDVGDELEAKATSRTGVEDGKPVLLHKGGKHYKVVFCGPPRL